MPTPIPITDKGLLRLIAWLSPSFPVGAYAYSHGAEAAVESGRILDRDQAINWISFMLSHGTGNMDATLFIQAYQAVETKNNTAFLETAAFADALKGTKELGLESRAQGQAFCEAVTAAWPDETFISLVNLMKEQEILPSYATVVAAAAATADISLQAALAAYLHAFAANITSAIVRLVPLGQTDGQRIIAALEPVIEQVTTNAIATGPENIGSAAFMVDWLSIEHETQYSR
ncbi:MAG: urease accessory protein UreF, partial [Sneathiellales bacterium]|nr:urease accessory protein UreF [Sneathiellales bacterium]